MKHFFLKFLKDEKGQTLAEYALLVVFIGLSALIIYRLYPAAIEAYVGRIFFLLSLPIP